MFSLYHFYLGKNSFSVNTFWTHLGFWRQLFLSLYHFYLSKNSFSVDTFWTHLVFWRQFTFLSLFISVFVKTAPFSIIFELISICKRFCYVNQLTQFQAASFRFCVMKRKRFCLCSVTSQQVTLAYLSTISLNYVYTIGWISLLRRVDR